jgi:hypothetical protein
MSQSAAVGSINQPKSTFAGHTPNPQGSFAACLFLSLSFLISSLRRTCIKLLKLLD